MIVRSDEQTTGYEPSRPDLFEADDTDIQVAEQLRTLLAEEKIHVGHADNYVFGRHKAPYTPDEASPEYRELAERSVTNMVPLVISNLAQLLYVEGYIPSVSEKKKESGENAAAWSAWTANRMALRQRALVRACLEYGVAYTVTERGNRADGLPVIRLVSPSRMVAGYEDPANDERPVYALEELDSYGRDAKRIGRFRLYRPDGSWVGLNQVKREDGSRQLVPAETSGESGLPHNPVVRHTYDLDIDGRYTGEVRRIVALQDRLNQTMMDRMLVQTYGSWKILYAAGLNIGSDKERLKLAKSRMLVAEDADTRFGAIPETPLDGFIRATSEDLETISAVGSIPPYFMTGELNNLGAEAIAEARASMEAKAAEIKAALSESIKQIFRDLALLMGNPKDADDYDAALIWHDAQNRSLSQVADALGKLATMLSVPVTELWAKIPGVTPADVKRWKASYEVEQFDAAARGAELDAEERDNAEPNGDGTDAERPEEPSGDSGSKPPRP